MRSVPEGFSGASPYDIQRYVIERIGREQLIDELIRRLYAPIHAGGGYELIIHPRGTVEEVAHAFYYGLIDTSTHEKIDNTLS